MKALRPGERPLDDGVRYGQEAWREVDGVTFCHWDRWILRLALDEKGGLDAIAWMFRQRMIDPKRNVDKDAAEAMHLQMVDLRKRLAQVQRTPETLLDDEERASQWLHRKAFLRVWKSGPNHRTRAMLDTPRKRLGLRALRGNWERYPVSPARYDTALRRTLGFDGGDVPWWETRALAIGLDLEVELLELGASMTPAARLALYRAALTVVIETMNCVDDSGADMAEIYRGFEQKWLTLLREEPTRAGLLRDVLELATWEDFGLTEGVEGFLSGLGEEDADRALMELAVIARELREHRLEYHLERARRLRSAVLAAAAGFAEDDADGEE
ncbi:MAG: hypothetical protein KA978_17790 [Deltaproteobacteria bacterium]|nr:hypothetical protein [Deltaproteobacteria bacterium]